MVLRAGDALDRPGDSVSHAYFVETGLVSVVAFAPPDHRIEVGMVGFEGMTGLGIVLGGAVSANETLVQSAGLALRISSSQLKQAMQASPTLAQALLRYALVFLTQGSQTALANGRGTLAERLARWLLMWHDRTTTANLAVTHEVLSLLLGVRRQGITIALHELEGKKLIEARRGQIKILDRHGLRLASNGFYGIPEALYEQVLADRP
jgi:CRP-like cAMP-binding protein